VRRRSGSIALPSVLDDEFVDEGDGDQDDDQLDFA
jgi:hypothetical protein